MACWLGVNLSFYRGFPTFRIFAVLYFPSFYNRSDKRIGGLLNLIGWTVKLTMCKYQQAKASVEEGAFLFYFPGRSRFKVFREKIPTCIHGI